MNKIVRKRLDDIINEIDNMEDMGEKINTIYDITRELENLENTIDIAWDYLSST